MDSLPPIAHELTNVQPTGEMISEWPLTPETSAAARSSQASAPIEHEAAVQSVDLAHAEASPPILRSFELSGSKASSRKRCLTTRTANCRNCTRAPSEDYEEETLENAADLGTMIREMSIDHITRPELPELDDDDDFDIAEEEMEEDELDSDDSIAASDIDEVEEEAGCRRGRV